MQEAAASVTFPLSTAFNGTTLGVDYPSYLSQHDIVYLAPPDQLHNGMPIGDGDLGAMVWCPNGKLCFQFSKSDLWNDGETTSDPASWELLPACRLSFTLEPSPLRLPQRFEQRLNLYAAKVEISAEDDHASCQVEAYAPAASGVVIIDYQDTMLRTRPRSIELTPYRNSQAFAANEIIGCVEAYRDRRVAFVCKVVGARPTLGWTDSKTPKLEIDSQRGVKCTVFATIAVTDLNGDPVAVAVNRLTRAIEKGKEELIQEHRLFWRGFWSKSFLNLTGTHGLGQFLENLWYFNLYQMGSASRGNYPTPPIGGLWGGSDKGNRWSGAYPSWNSLLPYWSLCGSNHLELAIPLIESLYRMLPCVRRDTQAKEGKAGVRYPNLMGRNGEDLGSSLAGDGDLHGAGLELASFLWWAWRHTGDRELLRTRIYPVLREVVTYFLGYLCQSDDGLLLSPPAGAECGWPTQELALLRYCLGAAIDAAGKLEVDEKLSAMWQSLMDRIPDLPLDEVTSTIEDNLTPETRTPGRLGELTHVFPCDSAHALSEDLASHLRTYEASGPHTGATPWSTEAVIAARLGQRDETARMLYAQLSKHEYACQGFAFGGPRGAAMEQGAEFALDALGAFSLACQEMVLQVQQGVIRVFPSVPPDWSGAFCLRTPGGFTVMAERQLGQVVWVGIQSDLGGLCRVENPWLRTTARVQDGKTDILRTDFRYLEFGTEKGHLYTIDTMSNPLFRMPRSRYSGKKALEPRRVGTRVLGIPAGGVG